MNQYVGNNSLRLLGHTLARVAASLCLVTFTCSAAWAVCSPKTFVVDSTDDTADISVGNGLCQDGYGNCTLHAAIEEANFDACADVINFNIPSCAFDLCTIAVLGWLPAITQPVTIDGYSAPGASPNTAPNSDDAVLGIEISGDLVAGINGITVQQTSNCTIRGLVINGFLADANNANGCAIHLSNANNNTVSGNFLGTTVIGNGAHANTRGLCISSDSSNNVVGGAESPALRNVISGNQVGIGMGVGSTIAANRIENNFIGLSANGYEAIGNSGQGIHLAGATGTMIGGTTAAARNVFAKNQPHISIDNDASGNIITGNYFGTDATGTADVQAGLPANTNGIFIASAAAGNKIGGLAPGEANLIRFSTGAGIRVVSSSPTPPSDNSFLSNSILDNVGLGIDLGAGGVTANDGCDADSGANGLQNFPVLSSVARLGGNTEIVGTLNSTMYTNFTVQFFDNASCDASGYGEGATLIGTINVETNGNCLAPFTATFPYALDVGHFVTATAMSPTGATSEFSQCAALACTPEACDDGNPCTDDACSVVAAGCIHTPVNCNDQNACTEDSCDPSTGCVYSQVTCDDQDACTQNVCDPYVGCVFPPVSCDDGTVCTVDMCDPVRGCFSMPVTCDDYDACTANTCDPIDGCLYTPVTCDDGNACTVDTCDPAGGCSHEAITCDDNDACTDNTCDPVKGCLIAPVNCDDQNACTEDTCDAATGCMFTPVTCSDQNPCTMDTCSPTGGCTHTPLDCSDGDACTVDLCGTGGCEHSPIVCDDNDPCTENSCNAEIGCVYRAVTCDDGNACTDDSCVDGQCMSTLITCDDSDPCTYDACYGDIGCVFTPVTCNDEDPCTTDTCSADGCVFTPVTCNDEDPCTDGVCDPQTGECVFTDVCGGACCAYGQCFMTYSGQCEVGTYKGDGTSCDTIGICSDCGNGIAEPGEQCDDGNTAGGDGCDGKCAVEPCWKCTGLAYGPTALNGVGICTPDDDATCDDGDPCTVSDGCSAGSCSGNDVILPAACRWVIVGGSDVQSRTRGETAVTGDICGGRVRLGEFSATNGDAVATLDTGSATLTNPHAEIYGDIVTGGGAVRGKPRRALLPGLDVDLLAGGSTAVQSGSPDWTYDTTGNDARVDECEAAQAAIAAAEGLLAGLTPATPLDDELIPAGSTLTLTASNPGGLNVFDFNRLISATDGKITLDGAGNPASVFVLRAQKKFDLRLRSKLQLTNGTQPGNVILFSQRKCRFGLEVTGEGTVVCPNSRLQLQPRSQWNGALVGGRGRVDVRDSAVLTHAPLQIGQ